MKLFTLFRGVIAALLAQHACAAPAPQGIDFDAVATLPPLPTYTISIGLASQSVSVNQASLIASVISAESVVPLSTQASEQETVIDKRQAAASVCTGGTPLATGAGPLTTPDTAAAFEANPVYSSIASNAPIPTGYTQVFVNADGSSSDYAYLGYTTLKSYDTNSCAQQCNAITDCFSINIYFERDPSVAPGTGTDCDNPPSTTAIKCVFWGSPISSETATNTGQYQDRFQVVIAGSNGYVKYDQATPAGYTAPQYLGNAAINAPLDCNGNNTYMGVRTFQSGPFDPELCAAACTAASAGDIANPPADGSAPQICTFFNTYLLYENGQPLAQYCALYNETWNATYATNIGQYDGQGNHYTIGFSYISSNATDAGVCTPTVPTPTTPTTSACVTTTYAPFQIQENTGLSHEYCYDGPPTYPADDLGCAQQCGSQPSPVAFIYTYDQAVCTCVIICGFGEQAEYPYFLACGNSPGVSSGLIPYSDLYK